MAQVSERILTVAEMRAAEETLIDHGESVVSLMQTAGQGAAEWVWRMAGQRHVTVLCGPGNNGGDGYVIAEALRRRDVPVRVVAAMEPATPAARNAHSEYKGEVVAAASGITGDVLVDCLFGSGLTRPLSDGLMLMLCTLAEHHTRRIAIDMPSGVASDSGQRLNHGLPTYNLTLALGAWKFAHWLMPACADMGLRRLVPIGVEDDGGPARLLARPLLHRPAVDAHKYRRGLLAIIGGAMPGAGLLAAHAAMHAGAGYVKLFAQGALGNAPADLVVSHAPLGDALSDDRQTALLIGPGLGRDGFAKRRLEQVLEHDRPSVLDADALMVLEPEMLEGRTATVVATPHAGELANLCDAYAVSGKCKLEQARNLAAASGMVIVAKGPDTIIAGPDGDLRIAPPASSWLSTAGTGDVLAGIIASRLATGSDPLDAAGEGVWLHARAAEIAGPAFTAGELAACVPQAVGACL